jgi:3-oxoacyl-[acyl-carrier-protein] synthase III
MGFSISGTGSYVPERVETAEDIAARIGRSADWIRTHTGVCERRVASESMAVMGAKAAQMAMGDGPPPDLIINASLTPIQLIPDSSIFIQRELGLSGIPCFSVHATCLSFVVALRQAVALVEAGAYRRILIVSAEQGSVCRDFEHPESAALIGDGAAAAVIEHRDPDECSRLLAWQMKSWPEGANLAELRGCGTGRHPNNPRTVARDNLFQMNGADIFRLTLRGVAQVIKDVLAEARLAPADVDLVVPHQPSGPGLAVLPKFGFPAERVVNIIGQYGNCIAASIPMALAHAVAAGRVERGHTVLLLGTSAGVSAAGALLRW